MYKWRGLINLSYKQIPTWQGVPRWLHLTTRQGQGAQVSTVGRVVNFRVIGIENVGTSRGGSSRGWGSSRGLFHGRPKGDHYKHFNQKEGTSGGGLPNRFGVIAIAALFPTTLVVYYLAHLDRAPVTGRVRMIDISREQEYAIGRHSYMQLLSRYRALPADHPSSVLVKRVGMRIAAASGAQLPWEFCVLDSPIINAACVPGGKVVVFSGLLELFGHDEEKVAVVMAHEIAHAIQRHSAEQLAFTKLLMWLEFGVSLVFDFRVITHTLVRLVGTLPYSRKLESEADFIGLELLAKTCKYSPLSAVEAMSRLHNQSKGHMQIEFLQTHPADERRIQQIREWATAAARRAEERCAGGGVHGQMAHVPAWSRAQQPDQDPWYADDLLVTRWRAGHAVERLVTRGLPRARGPVTGLRCWRGVWSSGVILVHSLVRHYAARASQPELHQDPGHAVEMTVAIGPGSR
eukprot:CAMPEP_0181322550 /NCGR_PEP_ID=MMETSP1101-20121128/19288_1 /TAXON_ID=46948 /ORGANISM="Rhodomonas abbreviata, Strain Caron Lab Isolate" /LENGTH=460 /DNA_ID=CAMNT_0023430471 /DNA_START=65 /DNA_END=1448 /DNA_ORIENTATION=+